MHPFGTAGISILGGLLLALLLPVEGKAQPHPRDPAPRPGNPERPGALMVLRDIPIEEALAILVERTGIDLLHGPEIRRERGVFCRTESTDPEEMLRCVVNSIGLDYYRLSSGTYVVIPRPEEPPR